MSFPGIILVPFGGGFTVSTLTTLLGSLEVRRLKSVLITLKNPDLTNPVTLIVDPSTSGTAFNTTKRQMAVANPGEEAHIEIQPSNLYPFIRVAAQTDSPFPVVNGVTFEVRGEAETIGIQDLLLRTVNGSQGLS